MVERRWFCIETDLVVRYAMICGLLSNCISLSMIERLGGYDVPHVQEMDEIKFKIIRLNFF